MVGVGMKIAQSRCRYRIPDGYFVDVSVGNKAMFAHYLSDPSLANIRMVSGWFPDGIRMVLASMMDSIPFVARQGDSFGDRAAY